MEGSFWGEGQGSMSPSVVRGIARMQVQIQIASRPDVGHQAPQHAIMSGQARGEKGSSRYRYLHPYQKRKQAHPSLHAMEG